MGLFAETVVEIDNAPKGPPCSVGVYLEQLDFDDAAELVTLLGGSFPHKTLEKLMRADNIRKQYPDVKPPKYPAISRHRKGECKCPAE